MDITAQAKAKILRRAAVSKMARTLKSRLQLAALKCRQGWRDLSLDDIPLPPSPARRSLPSLASLHLPPSPVVPVPQIFHESPLRRKRKHRPEEGVVKKRRVLATPPPSTPPQDNRGADLLMYLATSPSKQPRAHRHPPDDGDSSTQLFAVHSSPVAYMPTPGKNGFSLSEYIAMSPSPTKPH